MSVELYKCKHCEKVVTSDILNLSKEETDWFLLFENCICSKKCYEARERFFRSLVE